MPLTDDYAIAADLYDHVVPDANRPDVAFSVDAAREAGGPVLIPTAIPTGSAPPMAPTTPGELIFVARLQ